ncbi:MAG: hypothetical protein HXX08_03530 [Chloroflexi bacterium]|uniref:DUF6754 domain-containing protein n=1 Tax=Candidatus Chlorohelix allophototropha TaxID=3003348 RepID=A0A8T7LSD8_9CHLR|nr:hypothetical protein [Chloroflexota bacterium]WJW66810.1 hypothetical protein OZ401_000055 [Chloroflexota bacterium L227-S17]
MAGLSGGTLLSIVIILVFVILYFYIWAQLERKRTVNLRPLTGLNRLRLMVQRTVETGSKVHFSVGNGGLEGEAGTAETLSGISALSSVQQVAARSKGNVITTTNDSITYLMAAATSDAEYVQAGRLQDYKPDQTRFITQQQSAAFAAGLASIIAEPNISGSALIGRIGPEYLLVGDTANRRDIPQVVGTTSTQAMPLAIASAGFENTLLGEEVYAAPAYLSRKPAQLASLQVQDLFRILIIIGILGGVVAATLGFNVGDLFLR